MSERVGEASVGDSGARKKGHDWNAIVNSEDFQKLISSKSRFLWTLFIFSLVYYFALPVSIGYLPGLMNQKVIGSLNLAYLFALSQFFVAWGLAWLYSSVAGRSFDKLAEKIATEMRGGSTR
ncbi:MAG: DUF485 domain-containing protein [Actinobacteria bacterium]|nr:DUF485 domain-containing protein [Actinomycetota bacterium]